MSPTTKSGPKKKPQKCAWCNGDGYVTDGRDERGRAIERVCDRCNGNGEI